MDKSDDWSPEAGDESFVLESKHCFLTGISAGPPNEFNLEKLEPVRHRINDTMISNGNDPARKYESPTT